MSEPSKRMKEAQAAVLSTKAVVEIIKERFGNLSTNEVADLAAKIVLKVEAIREEIVG